MAAQSTLDLARPVSARATYVTGAALAAVAVSLSALTQESLQSEGGLGFDGSQYALLTSQCWTEPLRALEPFVYRIGAPCIAALLPGPPKTSLLVVNVTSSVLLLFLLAAWLRRHVPSNIVPWLLVAFAFHWLGPLRYSWWYPTYIDPPALCVMTAALLLRDRPAPFVLLCMLGALIRETTLMVPAAFAVGRLLTLTAWGTRLEWRGVLADRSVRSAIAGTIGAVLAIGFAHAVVTPSSDYWMADAALYWAYTKPFPSYALAWCITYGPILALPMVSWRPVARWLADAPEYAVLLAGIAVMAWIGGSDTERFLLWGAPIALAAIGVAAANIEWRRSLGALALLAAGQILNGRWFLETPIASAPAPRAWPILTPLRAHRFEDLLSQTPDHVASAVALIQYLALAVTLILWLRRRA